MVTFRALVVFLSRLLLVYAALVSGHASAPVTNAAGVQTTTPLPGFAASLQMIDDLLDRGRGIEAENVARALLARVESTMGRDAIEVADVLDLLGRAIRRSSKVTGEEKMALAERAVAIREKVLDPEHPQLATSLINLGVQRALAGDPAAARPLLERALDIREAAFGPDHPSVAAALQSLGGLLMTLHDDAGAMVLLDRAQQIRETVYGPGHADTVRTLVNLAIFHQEVGDYAGARQRYARALAMGEKMAGPADLSTLNVLTGAAVVLRELGGDPAGAAILNERLLALTERSLSPTDPRLSVALENLAIDRRELGDYAAAKVLAERSVAINEGAYGPNHVAVAASLHTLATILAAQGAYGEALRLFERATRMNEEVLRPTNPDVSRAAWFIPDLLPVSGYDSEDLILFEQAVAIRERTRGLANPGTAESLANLAALLSSPSDFRRTQPLFERALASQEKFLGPDHPEVAAAATNLAYVLVQTGNAAAAPLYERALGILENALGPDHPRVATALVNLAGVYSTGGNHDDARQLVVRALAIQRKHLGPEHPDTAHTLTKLADLAVRTGSTAEAFEAAADSEGIWREHVRLTARTLSERQALAYATSASTALEIMLSIAAARPADRATSARMWDALIQSRGIVLDEMAARHRASTTTGNPEVAALSTALASARQRLAALFIRGIRNDPPERYRRLLDLARDEKDSAERALAEKSDRFRDDQAKRQIGVADLSASLPRGTALVAFAGYRHSGDSPAVGGELSYMAFVLTGGDRALTLLPLGTAAVIEPLITQWQRQINGEAFAAGRAGPRGETAYRRVAEELRSRVWDPLVPYLSTATSVFIVPDGALHLVSFAALPTAPSRYLVETGPVIHYLSTERDLIVEGDRGSHDDNGLLAIGNPAFDDSGVSPRAEPVFRGSRSACSDFQSMQFGQLPASATEVNAVVTLWNRTKRKTVRLIGTAATEGAFKAQAASHGVLHLATHGFFLGGRCVPPSDASAPELGSARITRENPLLLSGLILAGANRREATPRGEEDGVLTAEEVAALNLTGVEWAVLSGCDTGVGEIRAGEGVFGLRRAFQLAGAKTVIMSLWPVEDQTTRQWMSALYENRFTRNLSSADAVRQASLSVLHLRRTKGVSTHPFYWAAFVAAGDWR